MWSARLRELGPPDRRSAAAIVSGAVAVLLIAGGIAFAAQTAHNEEQSIGPIHLKSNPSKSTNSSSKSTPPTGQAATAPVTSTTRPTTPTTVIGPNGETIVVTPTSTPTAPVVVPGTDTTVTVPPTNPVDSPTTSPPPTSPEETPTTERPPLPNQDQPQLDVSIDGGSMPEDPVVTLSIDVSDSDGYITSVDVTWEAGQIPTNVATFGGNACDNPPPSSRSLSVQNTFADAGTHSVSVTVTTVSCDGTSQVASRSLSVTSGGTNTTVLGAQLDLNLGLGL
jgi:hypothetical protein